MSTLFSQLQKAKEQQYQDLKRLEKPLVAPAVPGEKTQAGVKSQTKIQAVTQLSKRLSKKVSKSPSTEEIEQLAFSLRKVVKVRVNADVPTEWKERLDDLAHTLKVGKYDLMLYVIAQFLGEGERSEG
jgi:hypothetical protein